MPYKKDQSKFNFIKQGLPSYAEYVNIQDEDDGRSLGILNIEKARLEHRLATLLRENFCADSAEIRDFLWSSPAMIGTLSYSTVEEGESVDRIAYVEITHIY